MVSRPVYVLFVWYGLSFVTRYSFQIGRFQQTPYLFVASEDFPTSGGCPAFLRSTILTKELAHDDKDITFSRICRGKERQARTAVRTCLCDGSDSFCSRPCRKQKQLSTD